MKKKCKKNNNCYIDGFELPPCARYLGNYNPFVKDGKKIFRNNNRLYLFLSFTQSTRSNEAYNPLIPATYALNGAGNLQIDLYYFLIGLFINEVQKGNIKDYQNILIHEDEEADGFVKNVLENQYEITTTFIPLLTYIISNASSVIPLFTGTIEISPINYYIILMLSRFSEDYGMLYSDNAYVSNNFINRALADMYVEFYDCDDMF